MLKQFLAEKVWKFSVLPQKANYYQAPHPRGALDAGWGSQAMEMFHSPVSSGLYVPRLWGCELL